MNSAQELAAVVGGIQRSTIAVLVTGRAGVVRHSLTFAAWKRTPVDT